MKKTCTLPVVTCGFVIVNSSPVTYLHRKLSSHPLTSVQQNDIYLFFNQKAVMRFMTPNKQIH